MSPHVQLPQSDWTALESHKHYTVERIGGGTTYPIRAPQHPVGTAATAYSPFPPRLPFAWTTKTPLKFLAVATVGFVVANTYAAQQEEIKVNETRVKMGLEPVPYMNGKPRIFSFGQNY